MRITALKVELQKAAQKIAILSAEVINVSAMMAYKAGGEVTITKEDMKAIHKAQVRREPEPETGNIKYTYTAFEDTLPKIKLAESKVAKNSSLIQPKEKSRILKAVH